MAPEAFGTWPTSRKHKSDRVFGSKVQRLLNLEVSVDSRQGRNGFPMRKVFRPEVLDAVQDIALWCHSNHPRQTERTPWDILRQILDDAFVTHGQIDILVNAETRMFSSHHRPDHFFRDSPLLLLHYGLVYFFHRFHSTAATVIYFLKMCNLRVTILMKTFLSLVKESNGFF